METPKKIEKTFGDIEAHKKVAMSYKEVSMEAVKKMIEEKVEFRILGKGWKEDNIIFDYLTADGHIEFSIKITGWERNLANESNS